MAGSIEDFNTRIAETQQRLAKTSTTPQAQKERCEARGGTWDGSVCHYPQKDVTIKSEDPKAYKDTLERARMEATGGYAARSKEELEYRGLTKPTPQIVQPPIQTTPGQTPAPTQIPQEIPTIEQLTKEAQKQPFTISEKFGAAKGEMLAAGEEPLPAGTTRREQVLEHGDRYKKNVLTSLLAFSRLAFVEYDNLRATITGGDTLSVKDARQTFSAVSSAISADIEDVANGVISPEAVLINLQRAVLSNEALASQLKGKNIENFRYWIRDGKDIEVEVELNREALERMRRDLLIAIEQNRLQLKYG